MSLLEARRVTYTYSSGQPALNDVSLTLERGTILYLLGRNGCGKTTLMHCLSGALRPQEGHIQFEGQDLYTFPPTERARRIGLMPQIHTPAFAYTVREIVLMGRTPHLGWFGTPSKADRDIADEALASVGLMSYRDRPYTRLSGGERQLVLIARGLAQRCPVLLMDEPDAHLDLHNQHRVMAIVQRLTGDGLSFVIASHIPNNALLYAHQVMLMKAGRVLASGAPAQTLTEALLSEAYDIDAEIVYEMADDARIARAVLPRRPRG